MAAWTGSRSQQQVEDLWEGFPSAHTWIHAEHSWWQLIPRLVEAAAPAGSDGLASSYPATWSLPTTPAAGPPPRWTTGLRRKP